MPNNDRMYAIERSDEYLAHYGIKGMKWGVRKALASGNDRALARQYRKASRKLARLQKRATSGAKYARRAAALGAGAATAAGVAGLGTTGISHLMTSNTARRAIGATGDAMKTVGNVVPGSVGFRLRRSGQHLRNEASRIGKGKGAVVGAAGALQDWGDATALKLNNSKSRTFAKTADAWREAGRNKMNLPSSAAGGTKEFVKASKYQQRAENAKTPITNNQLLRAGAAAAGLGLAGAAGYNAYRAATTKRAARKAAEFQKAMNQTFKGTKYANGGSKPSSKKRRRR